MRLNNINTIEQANEFLKQFRDDYNTKFAKAPQCQTNAHRDLLHNTRELDLILSKHSKAHVTNSLEFFYQKRVYQIDKKATHVIHKYITLCDLFGKEQVVIYADKELGYRVFNKAEPEANIADEKTLILINYSKTLLIQLINYQLMQIFHN